MTSVSDKGSSATVSGGVRGKGWDAVVPKSVAYEDALSPDAVARIWGNMYEIAGMGSATEEEKKSLRAAVYVYGAINGTSREGDYNGEMILANGRRVPAAAIAKAAGKMHIRKFYRGNMEESYEFFKESRCMEKESRFVQKAALLGIAPDSAFAMADWMDNCASFTPSEVKAHQISFDRGVERARRARGGSTLETVESDRVNASLAVAGPMSTPGTGHVEW